MPDLVLHAAEEIILQGVRFGRASGFTGDDEKRFRDIDGMFHPGDLRRVRRIQHMQLRESGALAERLRQHLRTEAGAAHAEHDGVREALSFHPRREVGVVGKLLPLRFGAMKPAQPFVFVAIGPHRFVVLPEPANSAGRSPLFGGVLHCLGEPVAGRQFLLIDLSAQDRGALMRHGAKQLVEGIGEQLHAFLDELGGDLVERDSGLAEIGKHVLCA